MLHIREDSTQYLYKRAIHEFKEQIAELNKKHIIIGIPGGRSIRPLLEGLATAKLPWKQLHFFFVDERVVPLDHQESNFRQAQELLFSKVKIPKENIHPLQDAAKATKELKRYGGFDIIFLSSGQDGHIASLFPSHNAVKVKEKKYILIKNAPKPPPDRITASPALLVHAYTAYLFFIGPDKSKAYQEFQQDQKPIDFPAALVKTIKNVYVFSDTEVL